MRHTSRLVLALLMVYTFVAAAVAQPTTKPAEKEYSLSPMRVQQLLGADTFVYCEGSTTLTTIKQSVDPLMKPVDAARDSGAVQQAGDYVFVYKGVSDDMSKPITMQVGIPVKAGGKLPAAVKSRKLESIRAATAVYTGAISNMPLVYPELYGNVFAAGLTPTGEVREIYCYWEGRESVNNVIILQVAVK